MPGTEQGKAVSRSRYRIAIGALIALVIVLLLALFVSCQQQSEETQSMDMEQLQGDYVKPDQPIDRSKNVSLPGWGSFAIPANTKTVNQGFEFHNPAVNYWYEDLISFEGKQLASLVVDSGNSVSLDHLVSFAGVKGSAASVSAYDKKCFRVATGKDGELDLEAISGFDGSKAISVVTDSNRTVDLDVSCKSECYYMSFGLYLADGDELLYQSGLVAPGKYIQSMTMNRPLAPGSYEAYVLCQPYKSDKETPTNSGKVKITLNVK